MRLLCQCGQFMQKMDKRLGVRIDIKIFTCSCGNSVEVMD